MNEYIFCEWLQIWKTVATICSQRKGETMSMQISSPDRCANGSRRAVLKY